MIYGTAQSGRKNPRNIEKPRQVCGFRPTEIVYEARTKEMKPVDCMMIMKTGERAAKYRR
jgi:hypothetical protein